MATLTEHKPGDFCWMELGTPDQPASKIFYGSLLGWTSQDSPIGPTEAYTMFELEGRPTGGGYRVGPGSHMPGVPPHWDIYIAVASADAIAQKAAAAGATIIKEPFDVFIYGRMAVIQDPTGAIFCIWEAKQHPGILAKNEEGAFCWADLSTPDPAKAKAFYEKVFGWTISVGEGEQSEYLHIQNGEAFIGGVQALEHRNPNAPPHWLIYFQTADCAGVTLKATSMGARALAPTMSMPNVGIFSILADPQGAVFALYEPLNAA